MNAETIFSLCGQLALVGWILLIVAPRWRWSAGLIAPFVIPLILAVVYLVLIVSHWSGHRGGFGSLSGVADLFSDRWILLGGWIHYLAFDLFLGAWQVRDSARVGVPHWLVIPCLILTFLVGPVGLLAYITCRQAIRLRAKREISAG